MATIIPSLPYNLTNGTVGDANQVMADFNGIVNATNANAAHNGPNSDITAIMGLSTPLAINMGGTGQIATPAAFDALSPLTTVGDIIAFDGTHNIRIANAPAAGYSLVSGASAVPVWGKDRLGVVDGSNSAAGQIGEYLTNSGSVALSNAVITNILGLSLTAGDWDVWGNAYFTFSAANGSAVIAAISPVNNSTPNSAAIILASAILVTGTSVALAPQRFNVSGPTMAYLNAQANFASGTASVTAVISARRRR